MRNLKLVEALATKSDNLSLIPRTHVVEGSNLNKFLSNTYTLTMAHPPPNKSKNCEGN